MLINIKRLMDKLHTLGEINETPGEGYTRKVFSKTEEKMNEWYIDVLKAHNLFDRVDSVGNIFARYGEGECPILIGSHLDTVKHGGLYDGALGVMSGLEVLMTLQENNIQLSRPVEVVAFRGEEANILGGTFGSYAFTNKHQLTDTFLENMKRVGVKEEDILNAKNETDYHSYIELHIEQGQVLETEEIDIGIVTRIAGLRRYEVIIHGQSAHSGTTPMNMRADALKKSTPILHSIHSYADTIPEDSVLTIGRLEVSPNATNVVPNRVRFIVEIRSGSTDSLNIMEDQLNDILKNVHFENIDDKAVGMLNNTVVNRLEKSANQLGFSNVHMISGANHDANAISTVMPTGMIFISSKNGISHDKNEHSDIEDIRNGANVLLKYVEMNHDTR